MLADVIPFQFTPMTASEAGKKSGEARRARAFFNRTFDKPAGPDTVQAAVNAQLHLVGEQITRTRAVLNDDQCEWCSECERGGIQAHHRAQLLKALDSLLDRQRRLLGVPDPGTLRPRADKPDRRKSMPEPIPEQQTPQPVVACALVPELVKPQTIPPVQETNAQLIAWGFF